MSDTCPELVWAPRPDSRRRVKKRMQPRLPEASSCWTRVWLWAVEQITTCHNPASPQPRGTLQQELEGLMWSRRGKQDKRVRKKRRCSSGQRIELRLRNRKKPWEKAYLSLTEKTEYDGSFRLLHVELDPDCCKPFIGSTHRLHCCHVGATDTPETFSVRWGLCWCRSGTQHYDLDFTGARGRPVKNPQSFCENFIKKKKPQERDGALTLRHHIWRTRRVWFRVCQSESL